MCYKLPENGADPRHGRHPDIQVLVLQQLQHLHTVNGTGDKSNAVVPDPKLSDEGSHSDPSVRIFFAEKS